MRILPPHAFIGVIHTQLVFFAALGNGLVWLLDTFDFETKSLISPADAYLQFSTPLRYFLLFNGGHCRDSLFSPCGQHMRVGLFKK